MRRINSDEFALDLLTVCREVASDTADLTSILKSLFTGREGDSEFVLLLRAITRFRYLERAILDSLSTVEGMGPIDAAESYKDISRAVITAALVHNEEAAARLRSYYPHLLSEADIERIRLTVNTGMSREDLGEATKYLQEIQKRLGDRT